MSGKLVPVPGRNVWGLGYLAKLLEARGQANYMGEETEHYTVLIDSLCTS